MWKFEMIFFNNLDLLINENPARNRKFNQHFSKTYSTRQSKNAEKCGGPFALRNPPSAPMDFLKMERYVAPRYEDLYLSDFNCTNFEIMWHPTICSQFVLLLSTLSQFTLF